MKKQMIWLVWILLCIVLLGGCGSAAGGQTPKGYPLVDVIRDYLESIAAGGTETGAAAASASTSAASASAGLPATAASQSGGTTAPAKPAGKETASAGKASAGKTATAAKSTQKKTTIPSAPPPPEESGLFAGGDGTAEHPYLIANTKHLHNVRYHLRAHFRMIADVEFIPADFAVGGSFYNEGQGWEPIGTEIPGGGPGTSFSQIQQYAFSGVFDGGGFYIKGLYMNRRTEYYAGLFGVNTGTIRNVGMKENNMTGSAVGGIAGYNLFGVISHCYNTGSVTGSYAGGIVGESVGDRETSVISSCYNIGHVHAVEAYAGGIGGCCPGSVIENCYNAGHIEITSSSSEQVCAGGITGYGVDAVISHCYNIGSVKAAAPEAYAGGIAGYGGYDHDGVGGCYYLNHTDKGVGQGTGSAVKCTQEQMRRRDTFSGFDFDTVWTMAGKADYPYPQLRSLPR